MKIVNLTPHAIVLRRSDGVDTIIAPSGEVARVATSPGCMLGAPYRGAQTIGGALIFSAPTMGDVEGLPSPVAFDADTQSGEDHVFIVSSMVAARVPHRGDVFSPGTGPNDGAIRADGHIVAVTRLIRASAATTDERCDSAELVRQLGREEQRAAGLPVGINYTSRFSSSSDDENHTGIMGPRGRAARD